MSQNPQSAGEAWQEVHEQCTEATMECFEGTLEVQAALAHAWMDAVEEHTTEAGATAATPETYTQAPAVWIEPIERLTAAIAPSRTAVTPAESSDGDAAVSSAAAGGSDTTPREDTKSEEDVERGSAGSPPNRGESVPTSADVLQDTLDGVGPTYAERLVERGFNSIAAVAAAHPADLIEATNAPETRVSGWQEQARRQW